MSLLDKITAFLPRGEKAKKQEYFFAVNIETEQVTAALWFIEGKKLQVTEVASENYSSQEEIIAVIDKLLDSVVGLKEIEPQKILFGVPNSWILDDNLKDEYLKILRNIVKELELSPMAYVSENNALIHFLEKKEGVPTTAILVGFEKSLLSVTVVRAGKFDGVKVIKRSESAGSDIEKTLLQFVDVETLPSKILLYGDKADELKNQLLSFSWMSKLSFLHFPKIDVLEDDFAIKSICLAGGSEMNEDISFVEQPKKLRAERVTILEEDEKDAAEPEPVDEEKSADADFGFVVGDISEQEQMQLEKHKERQDFIPDDSVPLEPPVPAERPKDKFNIKKFIPKKITGFIIPCAFFAILIVLSAGYLFLAKADIKVFVEPKTIDKDATVTADPDQKTVNETDRIIPGQIITVEVSGSGKDNATGKKQIGDPAKGTVIIRNKTDSAITLSKGTTLTGNNQKFTLDLSVTIASRSADDGTWGKSKGEVTDVNIGADGNISSGTDMTVSGYATDKIVAKSEGNFAGGTSKDVTVVSSDDAERLLAKLSSDLRKQAQQKLQEKYPDKKILEEALSENSVKKSFSKKINDQASEFSLNMSISYKGTAYDDADLKTIVSKLVTTQVPEGYELDLSGTETQADVSKLEKNGKLIFLAKFKARFMPKIDTEKIKEKIKLKTRLEAGNIIKSMENVLGSEIKITPNLPAVLSRIPFLSKNITIEVRLK